MQNERKNNTVQRRVILEELRQMRFHPTADELFRAVKIRLPHISLGTVYRNLSVLEEQGLVRRMTAGRLTRFDGVLSDHSHLVCESCGAVEDVPAVLPADFLSAAMLHASLRGRVCACNVEFCGFCRSCAERNGAADV